MRSAIIAAAFAATVIAVPLENRAVVTNTDVEMVYVTDIVTVTRGAAEAKPTTKDSVNGEWGQGHHWWGGGHKHHHKHKHTKSPQTTWSAPPATSEAPTSEAPTSETWAQPTQTKKSAAPAPSGGSGGGSTYEAMALNSHNIHRSNHSASALQWDSNLVAAAKQVADSCYYGHNTDAMSGSIGGYGQNIAAGVDGDSVDRIITNMFYDSEIGYFDGLYGESNPPNFESWGHFSQMVWLNTERVGCYTKQCGSLGGTGSNVPPYFTVCNYQPPGNVAGQYGNNIKPPLGHKNVVIS